MLNLEPNKRLSRAKDTFVVKETDNVEHDKEDKEEEVCLSIS